MTNFTRRARPDDFAKFALGKRFAEVRRHYKTGSVALSRWYAEAGLTPEAGFEDMPVPEDFEAMASQMGIRGLSRHYKVPERTVRKWFDAKPEVRELWLAADAVRRKQKSEGRAKTAASPAPPFIKERWPGCVLHAVGPIDGASAAANYLRTRYPNVFRCDIVHSVGPSRTWGDVENFKRRDKGLAPIPNNGRGFYYVAGVGVIPAEDVIALAKARGFQGDAR